MRKRGGLAVGLAALGLGLGLAGAAWAQAPDIQLRSATWIESNYPEFARNFQLHGEAMLSCRALAQGKLDCKVVSETPAGLGFGAAALDVAWGSRLKPGVAAKGPIAFPVTFDPVPILDRPLRTNDPSADAMEIVTLMASGFATRRVVNEMWASYQEGEVVGLDRVPPATRTAAQASVQALKPMLVTVVLRGIARELDARATPGALAGAAAYLRGEHGRAFAAELVRTADLPPAEVDKAMEAWFRARPERAEGFEALVAIMVLDQKIDTILLSEELRAELTPVLRRELCARVACHPKDMPAMAAAPAP